MHILLTGCDTSVSDADTPGSGSTHYVAAISMGNENPADHTDELNVGGLAISTIEGGDVSDDGTALRLITTVPGDGEVVLSFPYEQLLNLIALAAKGRTDCKRRRGIEPNDDADLMATVKFELDFDRRSGMALVMFTLSNGAKLSFALPDPLPVQMHRILSTMLDGDAVNRHAGSLMN